MLKWAVNQPRPSSLAEEDKEQRATTRSSSDSSTTGYGEFHVLSRKSLDSELTSTPLQTQRKLTVYASTLPTFEAEYSPGGLAIPGPLLALRGLTIPDGYLDKPRYLDHKLMIDALLESTQKQSSTYCPAFDPASDLQEYWHQDHTLLSPKRRRRPRKRKITHKISSSVRHSAQKLLRSTQKLRHISPDSGHNSSSDLDFEKELVKRRLSYSLQADD